MPSFQPVIIGGDLGAYAIAREFNDAYGVKPIMVTAYNPNAIRDSAILTRRYCANASDEEALVADLLDLGAQWHTRHPDIPLVLMANTDWRIRVMARHREQLEAYYLLPIPPLDGSKILFSLLPEREYYKLMQYERFGMIILVIIILSGGISAYLTTAVSWVFNILAPVAQWTASLLV